jgi:hypothetical protein
MRFVNRCHQGIKVRLPSLASYTALQQRHIFKGQIMTTAAYSHNAYDRSSLRNYFSNLADAAGVFANALFAAQSRQFVAQEVSATVVTPAAKARNVRNLLALAKDYEHFSPNLAAELRCIAGRD